LSVPTTYFDRLYDTDDPFGYRSRWYEERKRNLLLAALPRRRYARAWEFGCSNGELTAQLADRCDALLATDISKRAVELAAAAVREHSNVSVEVAHHPRDWPQGRFDLIVFGEVGFYLGEATLAETARKLAQSLTPGGLLVGCHWIAPFAEAASDGLAVHPLIGAQTGLPSVFRYEDADFHLEGWSRDTTSVAQLDGIR
jgi:SAM-dependent methyltransferase